MATNGAPEQPTDQPQGARMPGSAFNISGNMLMVGGGGGAALVVVIVVVVLFATGVFSGGGGGASGGGDWLAYVPGDAAAVGEVDNRAFLGGDVPDDFVDYWEDADDGASEEIYDFVDIEEDDLFIHASTLDHNFDETLEILRGDFDFDVIREELEDGRDCEDDDYRGFEMWECTGEQYPAVALFEKDKYVVLAAQRQSDLADMLTYKSREPEKLANADDSDAKRLLGQTEGWVQWAFLGDSCPINRCQGFAIALGKSGDSSDMPASYALLFNSERAASAAEGDIAIDDLLEEWFSLIDLDLGIGEVKAEGEFIVGSGRAEFVDQANVRSSTRNGGSPRQAQAQTAATAAPAAPASYRDDWVAICYDQSRYLEPHQCQCLYQVLLTELGGRSGAIPDWDRSWDSWSRDMPTGNRITDVAGGAVDQMIDRGGFPDACR